MLAERVKIEALGRAVSWLGQCTHARVNALSDRINIGHSFGSLNLSEYEQKEKQNELTN